ncbi:MAG: hypothetical protein ACRDUT_11995 [Mycobacterium sp.]
MKFRRSALKRTGGDGERGRPGHLFGGHVRTSTVVLIVAFLAVWWAYDTYKPPPEPPAQVVPPGFVPDPNYTWVPRSRLQQPPVTVTRTTTPTTTTPTTTTTPSETPPTTTSPPPFVLPPPFGPPPPTTSEPGPSPTPTTPPPR